MSARRHAATLVVLWVLIALVLGALVLVLRNDAAVDPARATCDRNGGAYSAPGGVPRCDVPLTFAPGA